MGGRQGNGGPGQRVAEKVFSDVRKLERGAGEYGGWSCDFKVALASATMHRTVEVIETLTEEVDTPGVVEMDPETAERIGLAQRTAEPLQVLIRKMEAQAKSLVKPVGAKDGLRAWQQHHHHDHRKTFANLMRDHREVPYGRRLKRW